MARIPTTDLTQFLSELALLLQSQISVADALQIVQQSQDNLALYQLIETLHAQVESGSSLADSCAKHPQYFEPFWVDLLRQADSQPAKLLQIATYRRQIETGTAYLNGKLLAALSYFSVVFSISLLLLIIMLIYVIPAFDDLFANFGSELPIPTRWLVTFSNCFVAYLWPILAGSLLLIWFFWYQYQRILLYWPLIGRLYHRLAWITILRTWALMLSTHSNNLTQTLLASAQIVKNPHYAKLLQQLSEQVEAGISLSDALLKQRQWPAKIIHTVIIGTQTNQLATLLEPLAEIYHYQVEQLLEPTMKLFNLMIIILLGLLVGTIVIAVYLPIFKIGETI